MMREILVLRALARIITSSRDDFDKVPETLTIGSFAHMMSSVFNIPCTFSSPSDVIPNPSSIIKRSSIFKTLRMQEPHIESICNKAHTERMKVVMTLCVRVRAGKKLGHDVMRACACGAVGQREGVEYHFGEGIAGLTTLTAQTTAHRPVATRRGSALFLPLKPVVELAADFLGALYFCD